MENLNRPITRKEIESVIKKIFQQIQAQDQTASLVNFTKHWKRMNTNPFQTLPKKIEGNGIFPNSFYKANINYPIIKTRQGHSYKKKNKTRGQ